MLNGKLIETPAIKEEVVEPVEDTNSTEEETEVDTNTEVEEDDGIDEVPFLGKQTKLDKEAKKAIYQKGLNYDYIKEKADKATALEQENAELRLQMSEKEIDTGKRDLEKRLKDEGYDDDQIKEMVEPAFKTTQDRLNKEKAKTENEVMLARRAVEKEKFKDKPFYKEIESEINDFIAQPINAKVPMQVAYEILLGRFVSSPKYAESVKTTKQSAIADYTDKTKRGASITANATSLDSEVEELTAKGMEMADIFGVDPKKVAKYKKEQLKKG